MLHERSAGGSNELGKCNPEKESVDELGQVLAGKSAEGAAETAEDIAG